MRPAIVAFLALAAVAALLYWWNQGRPVELADAADEFVQCVSYSPYRRPDQTPLDEQTVIPTPQIEADLAILSARTNCVRTYSIDQGLSEVPRIAKKFGMKVILGLWIGRDARRNDREIQRGLQLLADYPGTIKAVVVGNEVLLRNEQTPAALRAYIDRVRSATTVPVTYAEVWEYWLRYRDVAKSTSFITVHILPYWEDDPAPIDLAMDHVINVHAKVKQSFPGQRILIGETGWPSVGRNRDGAQPSLVNQARFIREFVTAARTHKYEYNLIEAFDQPWKRRLEGTVGGYWGLYSADGKAKFPFSGPVAENAEWIRAMLAAIFGAAALVVYCWLTGPQPGGLTVIALMLAGFAGGATLWTQWLNFEYASRDSLESAVTGFYTLCALWLLLRLGQALNRWLEIGAASRPAPVAAIVHWFRTNADTYRPHERSLGLLRALFLFGAVIVSLLQVVDPRYRDFPLALYAIPTLGYALLSWISVARPAMLLRDRRTHVETEERWLAYALLPMAFWIALYEGALNPHAWLWGLLCVLFCLAVLGPGMFARRREVAGERQHA